MPKHKRRGDSCGSRFTSMDCKIKRLKATSNDSCHEACATWIQCENNKCLKWRQVTSHEAEEVGAGSWYCWMNKDELFNNCSVPEKKAKITKDLKFVYSLLPLGEVVMAKMPGYPLWPGLLTPDPTCGEYYDALLDKENEPTQYHVEFLGEQHSRAWLRPKVVHPYNSISEEEKAIPLKTTAVRLQSFYRSALDEAKKILPLTMKRRMQISNHFKVDVMTKDTRTCCSKEEQPTHDVEQDCASSLHPSNKRPSDPEHVKTEVSDTDSEWSSLSSSAEQSQPRAKKRALRHVSSDKACLFTLMNSDERNFFETVKSVFKQRGLPAPKQPMWRGQQVSLFDLYNAVQHHGGFESVCRDKMWSKIYGALVQSPGNSLGRTVRLFYQRHLLPYEMFVKGPGLPSTDLQSAPKSTPSTTTHRSLTSNTKDSSFDSDSTSGCEGEQKVPDVKLESTQHEQQETTSDHVTQTSYGMQSSYPRVARASSDCMPSSDRLVSPSSDCVPSSDRVMSPSPDCVPSSDRVVSPSPNCVPSSDPNSPGPCSFAEHISGSDSEDDDDDYIGLECQAAEHELLQLERLLSSLEPSLYPLQAQESPVKKRFVEHAYTSPSPNRPNKVDVLKTLDEMARIEGAIAELDTMVSLELDKL